MGATVLAIAGVYQLSALKYRCLDACRAPLSFVATDAALGTNGKPCCSASDTESFASAAVGA